MTGALYVTTLCSPTLSVTEGLASRSISPLSSTSLVSPPERLLRCCVALDIRAPPFPQSREVTLKREGCITKRLGVSVGVKGGEVAHWSDRSYDTKENVGRLFSTLAGSRVSVVLPAFFSQRLHILKTGIGKFVRLSTWVLLEER